MKKIIVTIFVLLALFSIFSCKKKDAASPAAPSGATATATPLTFPLSIDDFEDGNTINALGGEWFIYDDRASGGGNTVMAFSYAGGANSTTKGFGISPENYSIISLLPSQPSGYYGFIGMYTTITNAINLSSSTGIKLYVNKGGFGTSSNDIVNVWIGSKYEDDNSIKSRYRAQVTVSSCCNWEYITVPWTSFTRGYEYDSAYTTPPQTLNQVLTQVTKIGIDKEYDYPTSGIAPSAFSQVVSVDEITIY